MPKGLIIKALSGFYYVEENSTKKIYECRGRGVFRKQKITPLVGDKVTFQIEANLKGYVTDIKERKNELVRPMIANVDQVLLVFSVKSPDFSQILLDRLLAVIESNFIKPIIVLSKIDLFEKDKYIMDFIDYYESIGYKIIKTTTFDRKTIEEASELFDKKISVLAGQSGVGKSSLLNAINPNFELNTAEISQALGRGKHTTRHVELFKVGNGLVADTPGFSSLNFQELDVDEEALAQAFIDFFELSHECKFRGCLHINEPKCAVKARLKENPIYDARYLNYKNFMEEIQNQKAIYKK